MRANIRKRDPLLKRQTSLEADLKYLMERRENIFNVSDGFLLFLKANADTWQVQKHGRVEGLQAVAPLHTSLALCKGRALGLHLP